MGLIDLLLSPKKLPYDLTEWKKQPFPIRAQWVCRAWAMQGFGAPPAVTLFYLVKIVLYLAGWLFFCSRAEELGAVFEIKSWWNHSEALIRAILFTTFFEVVGLGGASGPLTARYFPPIGAITYFLRPGTVKRPLFTFIPDKRTWFDVGLYAALLVSLLIALCSSQIVPEHLIPIAGLLLLLGILDRTIYLAARGDIYLPMICCLMLWSSQALPALKILWFGIWFWAAFSKLTPNFPSVICVMICNSPLFQAALFTGLKKKLFRGYPDDLRPGSFAKITAHFGTLIEFSMPLILLFSSNQTATAIALVFLTLFHLFIFINFPMGVPMEWNIIMVYGGWVLFAGSPAIQLSLISSPLLILLLIVVLVVLPIIGHFYPQHVSFLISMRYYAGTWAYNLWLFKGKSQEKIDLHITKTSRSLIKQAKLLYDQDTAEGMLSRVIAFRLMHLPGRLLPSLLPKAIDNIDDYEWVDGEFIAGEILGWNFGDGHLSCEGLLASVQKRCDFESGELRVIMVESPTLIRQQLSWRIYDAHDGLIQKGTGHTKKLKTQQPWPQL